jgi:SRSO17 transposase
VATSTQHVPIGMDLYMPEVWCNDQARRTKAKIPPALVFRNKAEIALTLLADALLEGIPSAPVTADAAYGTHRAFRGELTLLGLCYAVGINDHVAVVCPDVTGEQVVSVRELALAVPASQWRSVTWTQGSKAPLRSRFTRLRVEVANRDKKEPSEQWLLLEWPESETKPSHYTLSTLPKTTALAELVRITKARWRTKRAYEDLKGELGLDHYEGRTYVGWQHHVSAVLTCFALVVVCQRRAFPSSATPHGAARTHHATARAALR